MTSEMTENKLCLVKQNFCLFGKPFALPKDSQSGALQIFLT